MQTIGTEVAAWTTARNAQGDRIYWMFRVEDAREKLTKVYPDVEATREAKAA